MKNTLGKMAYYIKGIEQIPNFRDIPVKIKQGNTTIDTKIYLFVILNGSTTGGFKMAPDASANDGNLDLVAIKSCNVAELINFFIKMIKGEHLEDSNVIHLTGDDFIIECNDEKVETDIDGERGPDFPIHVGIVPQRIEVFVP